MRGNKWEKVDVENVQIGAVIYIYIYIYISNCISRKLSKQEYYFNFEVSGNPMNFRRRKHQEGRGKVLLERRGYYKATGNWGVVGNIKWGEKLGMVGLEKVGV